MSDPRPVKFTEYAASDGTYEAEPLKVIGSLPAGSVAVATTTVAGVVLKADSQADSTAADVAAMVVDFNALLAKLRAAGILHLAL